MGIIGTFSILTVPYIMTQGGPNNATYFFTYLQLRRSLQIPAYGIRQRHRMGPTRDHSVPDGYRLLVGEEMGSLRMIRRAQNRTHWKSLERDDDSRGINLYLRRLSASLSLDGVH